jgi:hypothetical protein
MRRSGNSAAGIVAQGWNVRACGGGVCPTPATYHAATTACADFRSNGRVRLFNHLHIAQDTQKHTQAAVASAVASSSSTPKQPPRSGETQAVAVSVTVESSSSIVSVVVITKFSINMRRQEIPPAG